MGLLVPRAVRRVQQRYAMPELPDYPVGLFASLADAFGGYDRLRGRRILDLGCGCYDWLGAAPRLYEPWLCRLLAEAGAAPVGIDSSPLEEPFETHCADLTVPGALGFLPASSFDVVHTSSVLGILPRDKERSAAQELKSQAERLLRAGGPFVWDYEFEPRCYVKQEALLPATEKEMKAALRRLA